MTQRALIASVRDHLKRRPDASIEDLERECLPSTAGAATALYENCVYLHLLYHVKVPDGRAEESDVEHHLLLSQADFERLQHLYDREGRCFSLGQLGDDEDDIGVTWQEFVRHVSKDPIEIAEKAAALRKLGKDIDRDHHRVYLANADDSSCSSSGSDAAPEKEERAGAPL